MKYESNTMNPVELKPRGYIHDPSLRYMLGSAAAVAFIACGSTALGQFFDNRSFDRQGHQQPDYHQSKIVSGVWSLVLAHQPSNDCSEVAKQPTHVVSCNGEPNDPHLLVEQCHRDVNNANKKLMTVSFGDRTNEVSAGCYDDWVVVSDELWSQQADGSKIRFAGELNLHLEK